MSSPVSSSQGLQNPSAGENLQPQVERGEPPISEPSAPQSIDSVKPPSVGEVEFILPDDRRGLDPSRIDTQASNSRWSISPATRRKIQRVALMIIFVTAAILLAPYNITEVITTAATLAVFTLQSDRIFDREVENQRNLVYRIEQNNSTLRSPLLYGNNRNSSSIVITPVISET